MQGHHRKWVGQAILIHRGQVAGLVDVASQLESAHGRMHDALAGGARQVRLLAKVEPILEEAGHGGDLRVQRVAGESFERGSVVETHHVLEIQPDVAEPLLRFRDGRCEIDVDEDVGALRQVRWQLDAPLFEHLIPDYEPVLDDAWGRLHRRSADLRAPRGASGWGNIGEMSRRRRGNVEGVGVGWACWLARGW